MTFIDIGFSHFIEISKVISIHSPHSAPIRRFVSRLKKEGKFIDATNGRKTRSIIFVVKDECLLAIASSVQPQTIVSRYSEKT
jgi:extracellular matrix regulatory protein A